MQRFGKILVAHHLLLPEHRIVVLQKFTVIFTGHSGHGSSIFDCPEYMETFPT